MSVTVSPSSDYRIRTHTNKVRHSSTYLGLFVLESVLNHQFQSSSLSLALKLSSMRNLTRAFLPFSIFFPIV